MAGVRDVGRGQEELRGREGEGTSDQRATKGVGDYGMKGGVKVRRDDRANERA